MDKTNITYDHKDTHTHAGQYDARNLERLLPDWIQDLRNYFEKEHIRRYSFTDS